MLSTPSTSSTSLTDGATAELPLEAEESVIALSAELVFRVLEADELPSLLGQKLDAATARLVRALAEGDTQGAIAAAADQDYELSQYLCEPAALVA